eukprot:TRINITY_DN602_c0_g1::TRINITY_DN602_c0_g1_i1::g.28765::m.28765 TRINITY_DN602_c0_g1::TRINITY_DN602_c0_g1_i1::g.28765  ORF type:complete len:249 (+),score=36.57,EpsG/PF14897.1/0.0039,CD20/PF04103.10/8.8e+02,CD20/PF04103.10/0.13,MARVEL/PF01284.18/0.11,Tetraspannin/PF00335.15/0.11,Tetraspannin/PF00335.15/49,Glycophorin_A/PF01102.13/0.24,Ferric_reduct/PF01794.14/0.13,Ferric_reduct/PF01794.14/1.5e+03 TRINITY_DN602_c0_g1_i1:92-748(+)
MTSLEPNAGETETLLDRPNPPQEATCQLYEDNDHPNRLLFRLQRVIFMQLFFNTLSGVSSLVKQHGRQRTTEIIATCLAISFLLLGLVGARKRAPRILLVFAVFSIIHSSAAIALIIATVRDSFQSCDLFDCIDTSDNTCLQELEDDNCHEDAGRIALTFVAVLVAIVTGVLPSMLSILLLIRLEIERMAKYLLYSAPAPARTCTCTCSQNNKPSHMQ